ncbi:hypothetical protein KR032_001673 [Drosophila birchii]|nr:hypothetical protein KR032_001673 [Drosophila birchii]
MEVRLAAWTLCLGQLLVWHGMTAGQGYLEGEHRPLWILDDGLAKRQRQDRSEADYATTTRQPLMRRQARGGQEPGPITFLVRHEDEDIEREPPPPPLPPARRRMPSVPQRRFMMPHRLQLPHQYVQPNHRIKSSASASASSRSSHRRTAGDRRHLPVFDNAPGENSLRTGRDNYPIFVYNGTRGELILNTMLSRRRYPMQEPVPGQILYPPSTPMFRPKPIVERFRLPGQREMLNLTLIPFYAHEAIANPSSVANQAASSTQASPTPPSLPPYETQLPRSQEPLLGKRKRKKAKQYEAFHSPQEVMQWQSVLRRHAHEQQHDRDNHRHYSSEERQPQQEQEQEQEHEEILLDEEGDHADEEGEALVASQDWVTEPETETEVELPPEPEPETSTAPTSPSGPFQIVYLDDSLERPVTSSSSTTSTTTTTDQPPTLRQSSRYAIKREYYAFPVYTLGKLLQPQTKKTLIEKSDRGARRSSSERRPNTWFILNSRWVEPTHSRSCEMTYDLISNFSYKGPHHRASAVASDNQTKYYTSKYMESGFRPRR